MHFLLVEDDDHHARMIVTAFGAQADHTLQRVSSGEQALDYLERHRGAAPLVVILDLQTPGLSGFDVLEKIRENRQLCRVPIVVLSTSSSDADHERAMSLGANSYVVKPIGFGAFRRAVESIRDYWSSCNLQPARARKRQEPVSRRSCAI